MNTASQVAIAPERIDVSSLYRAFLEPRTDRGPEHVVFVEALDHRQAVYRIVRAVAAIEGHEPDRTLHDRVYNVSSARELIAENRSEDPELRLFETGISGGRPTYYVPTVLFLTAQAALIRKWASLQGVR